VVRLDGRAEALGRAFPTLPGGCAGQADDPVGPGFASVFVTARDGLRLHVRSYGFRVASALPVVCLRGPARTAADFHALAAAMAADFVKPRLVLAIIAATANPNTIPNRGFGRAVGVAPVKRSKSWRRSRGFTRPIRRIETKSRVIH
jgi:hypothetical protein